MSRGRIAALSTAVALALSAAFAGSASAIYHQNMVTEVHQGAGDVGDYVELQAYTPGQNLVANHYVITYDGGSNAFSTFLIPTNVANGANQATILIANDGTVPGADFNAADNLKVVNANGGVCFQDTIAIAIDCVRWGSPIGDLPSPAGTPLPLAGGAIPDGGSISRKLTRGCATLLDPADDTNNSAADFALATPSPRNNAAPITETPCAPSKATKKKCKKPKKKAKKGDATAAAKKKKCKKKKKKK
jgi:hypothetical protein